MNDSLISVSIVFFNEEIFFEVKKNLKNYLLTKHTFVLPQNAKVEDLLFAILSELEPERECEWTKSYLYSRFTGLIDGQEQDINTDYPLKDYIYYNAIDGSVSLRYLAVLRGGWGASLSATIRLVMPSKEHGHEKTPHVHVRIGRYNKQDPYKNTFRVKLDDLTIMDNAEKKAKKLLKNKYNFVMDTIRINKEFLEKRYFSMLKGAMTEGILLNLEEEKYNIQPNRFGAMDQ